MEKSMFKSKLGPSPLRAIHPEGLSLDESLEAEETDSIGPLASALPPKHSAPRPPNREPQASSRHANFGPIPWSAHFQEKLSVQPYENDTSSFTVYKSGTTGPVFLCLHGAGHSGLSWSLVASKICGEAQLITYDFRGHGETVTTDDSLLSAEQLVADTDAIVNHLFKEKELPKIVVVGHSLGGAIAIRFVSETKIPISGLVVIDVVEGTALQSLAFMHNILQERPSKFRSVSHAIEWSIRSNYIRNLDSARISVPPQVVPASRKTGGSEAMSDSAKDEPVIWRTDLMKSEKYWKEWFTGMSSKFLKAPVPKQLILAGTDRLDKELTIAQMQGKFHLVLMYGCGHSVHEDVPEKVASTLLEFVHRYRL